MTTRYAMTLPVSPDLDRLAAAADRAEAEASRLCSACLDAQTPEPFLAFADAEERAAQARQAHADAMPKRTAKERVRAEAEAHRAKQMRGFAAEARAQAAALGSWSAP